MKLLLLKMFRAISLKSSRNRVNQNVIWNNPSIVGGVAYVPLCGCSSWHARGVRLASPFAKMMCYI